MLEEYKACTEEELLLRRRLHAGADLIPLHLRGRVALAGGAMRSTILLAESKATTREEISSS